MGISLNTIQWVKATIDIRRSQGLCTCEGELWLNNLRSLWIKQENEAEVSE